MERTPCLCLIDSFDFNYCVENWNSVGNGGEKQRRLFDMREMCLTRLDWLKTVQTYACKEHTCFYLGFVGWENWVCGERSVSDVVTLRGNFILSMGALRIMLPGSRYDSWAQLYSKNSLLAFESLNQFPVSLYERWSTVWFAKYRLSNKPAQYLYVANHIEAV